MSGVAVPGRPGDPGQGRPTGSRDSVGPGPGHARAFTRIGRHNPKTRICAKCFVFAFP